MRGRMAQDAKRDFWNKIAGRYAARPLRDVPAYEAMLADLAAQLRPTDRVLEIGCGTGGVAIRLAPGVAEWTATDFSPEMVAIARAKPAGDKVRFVVADTVQALDGGPFDAICAFNILHLVDDLPGTLAHIHTNLTPGGLLISKTWCLADLPLWLRALYPALRIVKLFPAASMLRLGQLRRAFVDAGFEIEAERIFGARPQNPYVVARKMTMPVD